MWHEVSSMRSQGRDEVESTHVIHIIAFTRACIKRQRRKSAESWSEAACWTLAGKGIGGTQNSQLGYHDCDGSGYIQLLLFLAAHDPASPGPVILSLPSMRPLPWRRSLRPPWPIASSVSTICAHILANTVRVEVPGCVDAQSAGIPPIRLGALVSNLLLRADLPYHGRDSKHAEAGDDGVDSPVGGRRVPATGGRPDVLRVPGRELEDQRSSFDGFYSRDFRTTALLPVSLCDAVGKEEIAPL